MYAPVDALILTVPPPVEVAGVLYDNVRPDESVNDADPVTAPLATFGLPGVAEPATGVPASTDTDTVTVCAVLFTPLFAVTVKVSVVDPVAFWRWVLVGV